MKNRLLLAGGCIAIVTAVGSAQTIQYRAIEGKPGFNNELSARLNSLGVEPEKRTIIINATRAGQESSKKINEALELWKTAEDEAARNEAKTQLRTALEEVFTARQAAHEKEIRQLEDKVKELRDQLARRSEKKGEIIDFRLEQLVREAEGLGWGTETHSPQTFDVFGSAPGAFGPAAGAFGGGGAMPARIQKLAPLRSVPSTSSVPAAPAQTAPIE